MKFTGQYVAALEVKASRQNLMTHVRLYFNWQVDSKGLPMRARIAGRVTPSSQMTVGQLEMVELPLQKQACYVCCCKSTGNLAISSGLSVSIFFYCVKVHDISKLQFHDLEHLMEVYFTFPIKEVALCEDFLAAMSSCDVYVVRLRFRSARRPSSSSRSSASSSRSNVNQDYVCPQTVENKSSTDEFSEIIDDPDFVAWDCSLGMRQSWELDTDEEERMQDIKKSLHPSSWPLTVHLPSLAHQTVHVDQTNVATEKIGPVAAFPGHPVKIEYLGNMNAGSDTPLHRFDPVSLLYRRFPVPLPNHSDQPFCFHSLQFISFYISDVPKECSPTNTSNPFQSPRYCQLTKLEVFFSGPKEGFLYNLLDDVFQVSSYPFLNTIHHVAVESNILHAVAPTGIETYSLGHWERVLRHLPNSCQLDPQTFLIPDDRGPLFLGIHPFLNVRLVSYTDGLLVMLTSATDNSSGSENNSILNWTAYALQCSLVESLTQDLLENASKVDGDTECRLMHEAQVALATEVLLNNPPASSHISQLYQDICCRLGDFYLTSKNAVIRTSIGFYGLSGCSLQTILNRIHLLFKSKGLMDCDDGKQKFLDLLCMIFIDNRLRRMEVLSQPSANAIVQVFASQDPSKLTSLFLKGNLLGYNEDLCLDIMRNQIDVSKSNEDIVAACVICCQCDKISLVPMFLTSVSYESLMQITQKYPNIWVTERDGELTFSTLSQVVQQLRSSAFVSILQQLIIMKHVSANIVSILCLADWEDFGLGQRTDFALLLFLEEFLTNKSAKQWHSFEAVMSLVTLYVKCLANVDPKSTLSPRLRPECLFGPRRSWLNDLPPFYGRSIYGQCMIASTDSCGATDNHQSESEETETVNAEDLCPCSACNDCLLRLQSLLCSGFASPEVKSRVLLSIGEAPSLSGSLSLQVLCASAPTEATDLLISQRPKAVLEYCRDAFNVNADAWHKLLNTLLENNGLDHNGPDHKKAITKAINGVVGYLAEIVSPTELVAMLPIGDGERFLPYVKRCVAKHQAKELREIIMAKGRELKARV